MTEDLNNKLDAIFNARAEKEAAALHAQRETKRTQDATLQEFLALKDSLIRPTLEALAHNLSDRGLESRVFESQDSERINGEPQEARIGIRFLVGSGVSFGRGNEYPNLTLVLEKSRRKIQFFRSTMTPGKGGMTGGDGSADIGELTEQLIQQKALSILAEIL